MNRKISLALPMLFLAGFTLARARPAQGFGDGWECDTRELLQVQECDENDDAALAAAMGSLIGACVSSSGEVGCCASTCWSKPFGERSCFGCSGYPQQRVVNEPDYPSQPPFEPLPTPLQRGRNPVGG